MSSNFFKLACLLIATTGACANETTELVVSTPDRQQFEQEVYPVLLRDCGFNACHGSTERFLQVFGPGRGRMSPDIKPLDMIVPAEVNHSYDRARSMIDGNHPEKSLILRKPLAAKAGGSGHEGADELGRNVYQSKIEPGYAAIARWVLGAQSAPTGAMGTTGTMGMTGMTSGAATTPPAKVPGAGVQR
jgi:hypothetical protein